MTLPAPRPGILDIKPYKPGSSSAPGAVEVHKLSSNESALGASPHAMKAYNESADSLFLYPDGGASALRKKIAETYDLDASRIVCGAGSDEILQLLTRAYAGEGDNIVQSDHGFLVYALAAMGCGATPLFAKEKNLTTDVAAMLDIFDDRTRIVFVANPNNPTGSYLPSDEVHRLQAGLRPDIVLILDAAYSEYVSRNDYEAGIELVATSDNVVMTRTFSKIYGLAALRLGWMYAPAHICDVVNRIRGPFNVSIPALKAGVAAMLDTDHIDAARLHNDQWLDWLSVEIGKTGLEVAPSVANFLLIRFPMEQGRTARDADAFLMKRGLILRQMTSYGLPDCLRLTVGTEEANRMVVSALAEFMGKKAGG